jgi:hypothetical protein
LGIIIFIINKKITMANLNGQNIGTNYKGILNLSTLNGNINSTPQFITDGDGNNSSLSVSDTKVVVNSEIYIGNDMSGTWEPSIYNTSENNINISINPDTIVISNDYSTGSYSTPKTPGAIFEMASTTQGMLLPRMRTAERNAIFTTAEPVSGLVVYDTDLNKICYYRNSAPVGWFALDAQQV